MSDRALLAVFLVVSGASSLVYQVVWTRKLSWFLGADAYAVSAVLAAFFAGLAIGGAVFGARADRSPSPLRLYALLEVGTAVLAAGLIPVFDHLREAPAWLPALFAADYRGVIVRFAVAFAFLLPPTILIGGTFPAVARAWVRHHDEVGSGVGLLYAANTVGALAGALLAGFVLIRLFGINCSFLAAVVANLAVAAGAWSAAKPAARHGAVTAPAAAPLPWLILGLSAGAGFAALASEVLWTRALIAVLSTRAYAFSTVLAVYLLGIVCGSALVTRFMPPRRALWRWFGLAQVLAGVATLAAFLLLPAAIELILGSVAPALQRWSGSVALGFTSKVVALPLMILLPPSIAIGASFPLAAAIACTDLPRVGTHLGRLYAFNTAGSIAGAGAGGLFMLPALGLQWSLFACAALHVALGAATVLRVPAASGRRRLAVVSLAGAGATVLAFWLVPAGFYVRVATRIMEGDLLFFREDPHGTVAVVREPFLDRAFHRLLVDGVSNSGDSLPSQRYMRLQAHLPVLLHRGPVERALVICFGTGITYDALFAHPNVTVRRCVELSPAVLATAPLFSAANHGVAARPDADIRIADGRVFLQHDPDDYDVITLEPPPPIAQGVVNLYSLEFYELCRRHLRPGGLMAQWLPLPTQNVAETRMLIRTFQAVFPHATLWTTELHETLLIGGLEPLAAVVAAIARQMQAEPLQRSLVPIGIHRVEQLLATFLMDAGALRSFAGAAPLITDDHPRIEYAGLQKPGEFGRQLRELLRRKSDVTALPGLAQAGVAALLQIQIYRDSLHHFYEAGMAGEEGETSTMQSMLARALQPDADNEYYRWFVVR